MSKLHFDAESAVKYGEILALKLQYVNHFNAFSKIPKSSDYNFSLKKVHFQVNFDWILNISSLFAVKILVNTKRWSLANNDLVLLLIHDSVFHLKCGFLRNNPSIFSSEKRTFNLSFQSVLRKKTRSKKFIRSQNSGLLQKKSLIYIAYPMPCNEV